MKNPIYKTAGNVTYTADTCDPLRDAVEKGEVLLKAYARGQYPGLPIPDNALPGLRTVGFWTAQAQQKWGLDWHRNEGVEVTCLLAGNEVYHAGNRTWNLQVGNVTVCPPWQNHKIGNPHIGMGTLLWFILDAKIRRDNQSPSWPSWIILSEQDKAELLPQLFYSRGQVLQLSDKHQSLWKNLYRTLKDLDAKCPVSKLAILINDILLDLLSLQRDAMVEEGDTGKTKSRSETMIQTFFHELKTIPQQLEHPWTLKEMARLCRISPSQFSQHCRRLTNYSPIQALNHLRIERAKEMLKEEPECSTTEIAMKCGFTTSQYFATVFRKWTGQSPSEFRSEIVEK